MDDESLLFGDETAPDRHVVAVMSALSETEAHFWCDTLKSLGIQAWVQTTYAPVIGGVQPFTVVVRLVDELHAREIVHRRSTELPGEETTLPDNPEAPPELIAQTGDSDLAEEYCRVLRHEGIPAECAPAMRDSGSRFIGVFVPANLAYRAHMVLSGATQEDHLRPAARKTKKTDNSAVEDSSMQEEPPQEIQDERPAMCPSCGGPNVFPAKPQPLSGVRFLLRGLYLVFSFMFAVLVSPTKTGFRPKWHCPDCGQYW